MLFPQHAVSNQESTKKERKMFVHFAENCGKYIQCTAIHLFLLLIRKVGKSQNLNVILKISMHVSTLPASCCYTYVDEPYSNA
jgi:hypothetical protein